MTGSASGPPTTVVLGWDALDAQLVEEFGLADAFGEHVTPIETFANEVIGKPHTREVWPSIITGVPPAEHGIYAATSDGGVKWSNPWIRFAARVGQYTVPDRVRSAIGRCLRSNGAGVEWFGPEYYDEKGFWTVFDDRRALPIAVPNYRTDRDDELGLMYDRGGYLSQWLDRDVEGWKPADATQQIAVESQTAAEVGAKVGLIENALSRDYDLVFAWFGLIDTYGHVEPVAETPVVRRGYETAAKLTAVVRDKLAPNDRLICVSDHGLRDGEHTMDAVLATDERPIAQDIESVFDVAPVLDRITPARGETDAPEVRDASHRSRVGGEDPAETVRTRLEELGYV